MELIGIDPRAENGAEASLITCKGLLQAILLSAQSAFQEETPAIPFPTHGRRIEAILLSLGEQGLTPAELPLYGHYYVHRDGSIFVLLNSCLRCAYQPPYPRLYLAPPREAVCWAFPQEKAE